MSASIRLEGVSHGYGSLAVLEDLSLEVRSGEFVAIVGPSGCGKTTLLNLLSGSEAPKAGRIVLHGRQRMIYQQDGLLPWLTVAENIDLGLRHLGSAPERGHQLDALLGLIRLEAFAGHYPHQLSGGMRQRVELARALAGDSDVLLMDEPFSALDFQTRLRLRTELCELLADRPRTVVLVTHDLSEAAQLADRIVVLSDRPASILAELTLDHARPRELTHYEVVETVGRLMDVLGLRSARSATPGGI